MLLIPLILAGLTLTSHNGVDRLVYGLLTVGAIWALAHYGQIHIPNFHHHVLHP